MKQNIPAQAISCEACEASMEEYLAGELDTATDSFMAIHLATCEKCQREFQLAQAINEALTELPKPIAPPDIFSEVAAYVQTYPHGRSWVHRFFPIPTFWDILHSPLLRVSVLVCFIGIIMFGIHRHQQQVTIEQAKSSWNYAMSKMQYAVQRTSVVVNDRFATLKIDDAPRRALKPTANISSAIHRSLGILNHLTGDVPDAKRSQNLDTVTPNNQGGNTQ